MSDFDGRNNIDQWEQIEKNNIANRTKKGNPKVLNIVTSLIFPAFFFIVCLILNDESTETYRIILAAAVNMISVVLMLFSGIYFLILPLPIINVFFYGADRRRLALWIRIILFIVAFIISFCSIIIVEPF